MYFYQMTESEERFARLIWSLEPVASGELVKKCAEQFDWKKSTTYTVLKKLCAQGIFENKNTVVSAIMTEEEYKQAKSRQFVADNFEGSLPLFLTAFVGKSKLSQKQIEKIQKMIDEYGGE